MRASGIDVFSGGSQLEECYLDHGLVRLDF